MAVSPQTLDAANILRTSRDYGLDTSALRLLSDHEWPGNERELEDVLARAARHVGGSALTATDLALAGFSPTPDVVPSATPLPVATRRRLRARRPPRAR